eukprot:7125851-Prymnesium_polylepis.1
MDPRLSGVALTSTCGRRVAVDVVLGCLAEMPTVPDGGETGGGAQWVSGVARERAASCQLP